MTEPSAIHPDVESTNSTATATCSVAPSQLPRPIRRAIAAEEAFVVAATERSKITRELDRLRTTLAEIDDAVSASEQRRAAMELEAARLRALLAPQKARHGKKKQRSIWRILRKRLTGWSSSSSGGNPRPREDSVLTTAAATAKPGTLTTQESLSRRFESLEPLRTFPELRGGSRVSIVTDSVSPGLLYGGVGTAILLGTLLANRLGADLRLITRHHEADPGQVGALLATFGLELEGSLGCVYSPPRSGAAVSTFAGDVYVTTSWWTTQATLAAVDPRQIVYLLQEDERMFYPRGDERQRCSEILGSEQIRFVVNSELLYQHFCEGDEPLLNIAARGHWFEPAFPNNHYWDNVEQRRQRTKRNFLFYARPNNLRNMYWRGLEAIAAAIEDSILPPEQWNFVFVGRDLESISLPFGTIPRLLENLSWKDYAALIREVDLGLSLIDTPHPSYPPLDLAASGAVVVTNRCGVKTSLDRYSANIICATPSVPGLTHGIRLGLAIVADERLRVANFESSRIMRDWPTTLDGALRFCAAHRG